MNFLQTTNVVNKIESLKLKVENYSLIVKILVCSLLQVSCQGLCLVWQG